MLAAIFAQVDAPAEPATVQAAQVLLDVQHLTILLIVAGLIVGALRGRWKPREERAGIPSQPYNAFDLGVAASILLFYYGVVFLAMKGQMSPKDGAEPAKMGAAFQFVVSLVLHGFYVGLIFAMVKFGGLDRSPTQMFGLKRLKIPQIILWSIVGGVIATPAVLSLVPVVQEWLTPIFGPLGEQDPVRAFRETEGFSLDIVLLIISAVVIAPIAEEVIFRGYVYGVLKRFTDPMFACLAASLFFAVVHLNLPALLPLCFFAIFLTLLYEATRCLWVTIGVHALFNATNIVLMFVAREQGDEVTELSGFFFYFAGF